MSKTLNVYLNQRIVGQLIQDDYGQMVFEYDKSWLDNPDSTPLSQSLPLQSDRFSRKECRGFFAGLLPEESKRDLVAKNLGISKKNDFAMLEQIGGECAGAITFVPEKDPPPSSHHRYREISEEELGRILELLPRQPLLAGEDDLRLSLAGAQDKISVYRVNGVLAIPLNGAPSTHIIKPENEHFNGLVTNEAFCLKLARLSGLDAATAEIHYADGIEYLQIERYDRIVDQEGRVFRLHQEDFCQALGVPSDIKYQSEGGPTLKDCFDLIRKASSRPVIDLRNFLDAVIFNLIIGNHDAHGKNFSFIYKSGKTSLAPLYDLICTVYYSGLTKKMAMKIGKEAISDQIYVQHFERLADDAGLAKPFVKKRVIELTEKVRNNLTEVNIDNQVAEKLRLLIDKRCDLFLQRFS